MTLPYSPPGQRTKRPSWLTATDSAGSLTYTIVGSSLSGFVGFVSDATLVSLEVASVTPNAAGANLWPSADNVVLAIPVPVPEPESYALMLSGLALVSFLARRRAGRGNE